MKPDPYQPHGDLMLAVERLSFVTFTRSLGAERNDTNPCWFTSFNHEVGRGV